MGRKRSSSHGRGVSTRITAYSQVEKDASTAFVPPKVDLSRGRKGNVIMDLTLGTSAKQRTYVSSLKRTWLATFSLTFPLDHFCSRQEQQAKTKNKQHAKNKEKARQAERGGENKKRWPAASDFRRMSPPAVARTTERFIRAAFFSTNFVPRLVSPRPLSYVPRQLAKTPFGKHPCPLNSPRGSQNSTRFETFCE